MSAFLAKLTSVFMTVVAFFCGIFGIPYYAVGDAIEPEAFSERFTLTFCEDFDEPEIDPLVWSGHYVYGQKSSIRNGGYWNNSLPFTRDGTLVIPAYYSEQGMGDTGAGWYSCGIDTDDDRGAGFSQLYGYFETRCILPKGMGIWAAFWTMCDGVYNVDGNGVDGTEIDIFESQYYDQKYLNNRVSSNLHFDGYDEAHQSMGAEAFLVKGNPYEEFNTYAVEWNEDGYIFYINGVESLRTDFGGVCKSPSYAILSVEFKGNNGVCDVENAVEGDRAEYIVDYVKIYQYNDLL